MSKSVKKKRNNESGVISLVFAGFLAVIMATLIAQIMLNQQNQNFVHAGTRTQIIIQQRLRALALEFEEAAKQAEVSLGCPPGRARRVLNGKAFCLPAGASLCTSLTKVINGRQIIEQFCTSSRAADIAWNDANSGNEVLAVDPPSPINTGTRYRIRVPDVAASPLWQSCTVAGVTCLRVYLCQDGDLTCTFANAVAYQVVKF